MTSLEEKIQYVIDLVSVSKSFKRQTLKRTSYTTIKSTLLKRLFSFGQVKEEKTQQSTLVLDQLTLRIPKGDCVGIIGRNGSGKSTLLKLITGIYRPSSGTVRVQGRLAALIELGAGFHPDFSGRENLFLAGIMYGMTNAEIEAKFSQIVDFAELRDVIDDPVRTYSSGMFMRLGFSLAVHTDPDILIIDEVLSVGDASFVKRCQEKITELRRQGKTLLIVSHDLEAVEHWCDEVIWLAGGKVKDRGEPRRVIDNYLSNVEERESSKLEKENLVIETESQAKFETQQVLDPIQPQRWGSREIEISAARLLDKNNDPRLLFHSEDLIKVEFDYIINQAIKDLVFGIAIHRDDGLLVYGSNTDIEKAEIPNLKTKASIILEIQRIGLLEGNYTLDLAVHTKDGYAYDYHKNMIKFAIRWPQKQVGVILPKTAWDFKAAQIQAGIKKIAGN